MRPGGRATRLWSVTSPLAVSDSTNGQPSPHPQAKALDWKPQAVCEDLATGGTALTRRTRSVRRRRAKGLLIADIRSSSIQMASRINAPACDMSPPFIWQKVTYFCSEDFAASQNRPSQRHIQAQQLLSYVQIYMERMTRGLDCPSILSCLFSSSLSLLHSQTPLRPAAIMAGQTDSINLCIDPS